MRVLFVSYEVAPLYKFGGLGDIAFSLPKALENLGVDIRVGMPAYHEMSTPALLPGTNVPMLYARDHLFQKPGIIGIHKIPNHRAQAYAYFAQKILSEVKKVQFIPDIIHLNDWHTALIAFLLKMQPDPYFAKTRILLTIHNTRHQGKFPIKFLLENPQTRSTGLLLAKHGRKNVNYLRRGIIHADWITTVSTYFAREIIHSQFGFGMTAYIQAKANHFQGILNGIDYDQWNTSTAKHIHTTYSVASVKVGKEANKQWLQEKVHLPIVSEVPLYAMIARLSWQKGFRILTPVLEELLEKRALQVVVLGQGAGYIAESLKHLTERFPRKMVFLNTYSESYAQRIYAGSDFFLVPSVFEPCGLTQMIAMRYGTLPLTTAVGGLADTVTHGKTGFVFHGHNQRALKNMMLTSLDLFWNEKELLQKMRTQAMRKDFSSRKSARAYLKLYQKMLA